MIGDDDEVTLEHAIELYRSLPDGELAVIPGTSHGLLVEKPALCNTLILDFLNQDPVPTTAPISRASKTQAAAIGHASTPASAWHSGRAVTGPMARRAHLPSLTPRASAGVRFSVWAA
jgi:hypothetical protein